MFKVKIIFIILQCLIIIIINIKYIIYKCIKIKKEVCYKYFTNLKCIYLILIITLL